MDFSEGDALLDDGRVLDATALSLAAAANHAALDVVCRPLVAIIATGDELVSPGGTLGPDQIIASNIFGVAAIALSAGAKVVDLGIVPDRTDEIAACLTRGMNSAPTSSLRWVVPPLAIMISSRLRSRRTA